jgi:hypothetical protein
MTAEVEEVGDHAEQRGFLTTVLSARRSESTAHLPVKGALHPQAACLVKKGRHLGGDAAEARPRTDDDRVVVGQVIDLGDGRRLIELEVGVARDLLRDVSGTRMMST